MCWLVYASAYVCRLNYSAVMPELAADGTFSGARLASVSSAFFICYGTGQLLNGLLGDRLNPRLMIFGGVAVSGLSNVLIFFFHAYPAMLLLWGVNGAAQSAVWAPILKLASLYFGKEEKERFSAHINTTTPLGTLACYAVSLLSLLYLPWPYVFLFCGLTDLLSAALWLFCTRKLPKPAARTENRCPPPARAGIAETLRQAASGGVLLLLFPIAAVGTLRDGVTQWVPTFFSSEFGSETTLSLALTMVLPVVNVSGAYLAQAVGRRLHGELGASAFFFCAAAAFLTVLRFFAFKSMAASLVCMAGVTVCMLALTVTLITQVPLAFYKIGRVGTVGGLIDATAYVGCGTLNLAAGRLLENGNDWNRLFILWLCLAGLAAAVTLACIPKWKRFTEAQS